MKREMYTVYLFLYFFILWFYLFLGSLIQMSHNAKFVLCTDKSLAPIASKEEVLATSEEKLPDIYPLSPFINSWQRTNYATGVDGFGKFIF